eukprot:TRINITY_DN13843_c0_g1_i2.p1 TRINITY_DN13843_c0_g1~~TRINITY_DN13843_c0_g1_i2.p1  ORF type:complete len:566 (-),score=124.53 TRINITY_DN13843_c0_g1_i2:311-2008(-)
MADHAAGGGRTVIGFPSREKVSGTLSAINAAQDGLTGLISSMANEQSLLAGRLDDTHGRLGEFSQDLEKVFRRMQQVEARQVQLFQNQDAKLQVQLQEVKEETHATARTYKEEWRGEVEELRRSFAHEARIILEESKTGRGFSEETSLEMQQIHEELEQRVNDKISLQREEFDRQLQDLQKRVPGQFEEIAGSCSAQRELIEATGARVRAVEQRSMRNSSDLKKVLSFLEQHGLTKSLGFKPIGQQLASMEANNSEMKGVIEGFQDRFQSCMQGCEDALRKLDEGNAKMSTIIKSREELERQQRSFSEWAQPILEVCSALPSELKELVGQLESVQKRQNRCDDDLNKLSRLGRILDDKVESFDEMERRMEVLSSQAQKLMGAQYASSVRCLSCSEAELPSAIHDRGRTPSPTRTGGVVNHQFEAAQLARRDISPTPGSSRSAGQRARPQSAGVRRTCDREQDIHDYAPAPPFADASAEQPLGASAGEQQIVKRKEPMLVLTVPQVRMEMFGNSKLNGFKGVYGTAIQPSAPTPGPVVPKAKQPARRPMSARARMQMAVSDRLVGS